MDILWVRGSLVRESAVSVREWLLSIGRSQRRATGSSRLPYPSLADRLPQQVVGDFLYALVGAVRAAPVRPWQHVARRGAHRLRPEDGRGVEDEVAFRARVDGCRPA